jgi:hypothetical protein
VLLQIRYHTEERQAQGDHTRTKVTVVAGNAAAMAAAGDTAATAATGDAAAMTAAGDATPEPQLLQ